MTRRICIYCIISLVWSLNSIGQTSNQKEILSQEVKSVSKRLLSVLDSIPGDLKWPPVFEIIESDEVNAFAGVIEKQPKVIIHTSVSNITEGIPDRLAYIIAHELIHIVKGHCSSSGFAGTGALKYNFSRANEEVADIDYLAVKDAVGGMPEEDMHCATLAADTLHESLRIYCLGMNKKPE